MKKLICILLIFVGLATKAQTYSITGTVSDEKGPLPGATVFIDNSKHIMATNNEGKFNFGNIQPGTYEVVVKMIGFKVFSQSVSVKNKPIDVSVKLKESNTTLNAVNINAVTGAEREVYLQLFIKYFIGQSANAEKCTLLNPDAINFNFDKRNNILEATSDEFIIVENKGLGYKLHYLAAEFKVDMRNRTLANNGSLYFEDMQGTKSQLEKWEMNRKLTYEGSMGHFFKAAFNNTLRKDGFLVFRFPEWAIKKPGEIVKPVKKDENGKLKIAKTLNDPNVSLFPLDSIKLRSLITKVDENFKLLHLDSLKKDTDDICIIYTKRNEPAEYFSSTKSIVSHFIIPKELSRYKQTTIIQPVLDSRLFDRNGNIRQGNSIARTGFWAWQRAGDFLPPDYEVPAFLLNEERDPSKKKE